MNLIMKSIIFGLTLILFSSGTLFADLKNFKKDFENPVIVDEENANNSEEVEYQEKSEPSNRDVNSNLVTITGTTSVEFAKKGKLKDFYEDFKKEKNNQDEKESSGGTSYPSYYRRHIYYYHYHYPYYYPYYIYYPLAEDVYYDEPPRKKPEIEKYETKPVQEPQTHEWFNTSLKYRYVSESVSSIGMILSIVSAGRRDELSFGFKFDYDLLTEKDGVDFYSLPLFYLGLTIGKQFGKGVAESYFAYCRLENLDGFSLKFSADQYLNRDVFFTAGIGASIINNSPLTEGHFGAGIGNTAMQFVIGYRFQNSVNHTLNGPEIKLGMIF